MPTQALDIQASELHFKSFALDFSDGPSLLALHTHEPSDVSRCGDLSLLNWQFCDLVVTAPLPLSVYYP